MEGGPEFQPRGGLRDPEQRAGLQHRDLRAKHRVCGDWLCSSGKSPRCFCRPHWEPSPALPWCGHTPAVWMSPLQVDPFCRDPIAFPVGLFGEHLIPRDPRLLLWQIGKPSAPSQAAGAAVFLPCLQSSQSAQFSVSRFLGWEPGSSPLSLPGLLETFWMVPWACALAGVLVRRTAHVLQRNFSSRSSSRVRAPGSVWTWRPLLFPFERQRKPSQSMLLALPCFGAGGCWRLLQLSGADCLFLIYAFLWKYALDLYPRFDILLHLDASFKTSNFTSCHSCLLFF